MSLFEEFLIAHHTQSKDSKRALDWQGIRNYHVKEKGWRQVGYHFGIEKVNDQFEILVGRFMNQTGAHCKHEGMNHRSLGIAIVGNFDLEPPDELLWEFSVEFFASTAEALEIRPENILGHGEVSGSKTCPGERFSMVKFRKHIKELL